MSPFLNFLNCYDYAASQHQTYKNSLNRKIPLFHSDHFSVMNVSVAMKGESVPINAQIGTGMFPSKCSQIFKL